MSGWLPRAPCTPAGCAVHRGPAVAAPVAAGRLLSGAGLLVAGVVLAPVTALLGAVHRDRISRRWARALLRGFGVRVRVHGPGDAPAGSHEGGVLVVANHISWLDIPLVATVLPGRNLAKSEIRGWPVLGRVAAGGGTLFVERERLRALPGTVRTLAHALGAGSRVVVFPEACTWCGRAGGRFTSAVFQAALDAGTAVRPVRISYRAADGSLTGAAAFVGEDTLPASLWRVAAAGGITAEITVLPEIPAGAFTDRRDLAAAAWHAVYGTGRQEAHRGVRSAVAHAQSASTVLPTVGARHPLVEAPVPPAGTPVSPSAPGLVPAGNGQTPSGRGPAGPAEAADPAPGLVPGPRRGRQRSRGRAGGNGSRPSIF